MSTKVYFPTNKREKHKFFVVQWFMVEFSKIVQIKKISTIFHPYQGLHFPTLFSNMRRLSLYILRVANNFLDFLSMPSSMKTWEAKPKDLYLFREIWSTIFSQWETFYPCFVGHCFPLSYDVTKEYKQVFNRNGKISIKLYTRKAGITCIIGFGMGNGSLVPFAFFMNSIL